MADHLGSIDTGEDVLFAQMSYSEQLRWCDEFPEQVVASMTGNFYCKCPGGMSRMSSFPGDRDVVSIFESYMRVTYRTFLQDAGIDMAEAEAEHSEKRLACTGEGFFAEVDAAIMQVGLSMEYLADQNARIILLSGAANDPQKREEREALIAERAQCITLLCESILPVYQKLRAAGYTHYDLVR